MKTLKVILTIVSIMFINQISYSYIVHVTRPNPCEGFPSHELYPAEDFHVDFRIERHDLFDTDFARVRIYVKQGDIPFTMYINAHEQTNVNLSTAINLLNYPGFCANKITTIIVEAFPQGILTPIYYGYGYVVVHRNEVSCQNATATNGTSTQTISQSVRTFYGTNPCGPLASANYIINQHRIRFTFNGNFNNSWVIVDEPLCLGFSNALPNYQLPWARVVNQTNSQVVFETFTYKVWGIDGAYLGWFPCPPEEAKVVYYTCRSPVLDSLVQWPKPITPRNNLGYVFRYIHPVLPNTIDTWSDLYNIHKIEFTPMGDRARIIRHRWGVPPLNQDLLPPYQITYFGANDCGQTVLDSLYIIWGQDPPYLCPEIGFYINGERIIENHILNQSPQNPDMDVTDKYIISNPELPEKEFIEFDISEAADDETKLDLLELYKFTLAKEYNLAVTNEGKEICYEERQNSLKALYNKTEDITYLLYKNDNKVKELKEGDTLEMSFIPDNSNYVVLRIWGPTNKDKIAGTIVTDEGKENTFLSRNNESSVCIELDKDNISSLKIVAKQSFTINQIQMVKNEGTFVKDKLDLKSAFNKSGDIQKKISSSDKDYAIIAKDNSSSFSFVNKIDSNPNFKQVYVLTSMGSYKKAGESQMKFNNDESGLPGTNKLFNNIPNPFNPATSIKFEIKNDAMVKVSVYDITGREIKSLVNEFKKAGEYKITFDGSGFASGIYFYKMQTGEFIETKRMILIK
ncbi:MAG: T9SS type A sorting domain-containing protein [Bacteroidota bacterium]|nr:T9SS type A sorting domain-containing protein [Bacteroidota bacterium]